MSWAFEHNLILSIFELHANGTKVYSVLSDKHTVCYVAIFYSFSLLHGFVLSECTIIFYHYNVLLIVMWVVPNCAAMNIPEQVIDAHTPLILDLYLEVELLGERVRYTFTFTLCNQFPQVFAFSNLHFCDVWEFRMLLSYWSFQLLYFFYLNNSDCFW